MTLDADQVILLPGGTEISIEAALGDLARAAECLQAIRDGELDDSEWPEVDGLLCDLPHIGELIEALALRATTA